MTMAKVCNAGSAAVKGSLLFALTICAEAQVIAFTVMVKKCAAPVAAMATYDA
jgi:hypothetical protein